MDTPPHLREFMAFLDHLNAESERGQVLVCATVIDDLLARIIAALLIEGASALKLLGGFNAPLGTFSARIEAAAAMGLISELEQKDATLIRKIRNDFAHSLNVSFATASVKSRCAALHFSAKLYEDVTVSPRGQFSTAATGLILNLYNRPHYVSQRRLTRQEWRNSSPPWHYGLI